MTRKKNTGVITIGLANPKGNASLKSQCPVCSARFVNKAALHAHMLDKHPVAAITSGRASVRNSRALVTANRSHATYNNGGGLAGTAGYSNSDFMTSKGMQAGPLQARQAMQVWRNLGSTEEGRRWAMSALHPCEDALATPMGIPDHTQVNVVTPSFRNTTNISAPSDITGATWDLQFVTLPIPEVDYIWRYRSDNTANWSAWRLVRPSTFPGQEDGSATTLGESGYSKYRYQGRGYTFHHIASATTNEGVVVAGQIDAVATAPQTVTSNTPKAAGNDITPVFTRYKVPSSSQELTQQDSLAIEWNAEKGMYLVMRFPNPVHQYVTAATGGVVSYGSPVSGSVPDSFFLVQSALTNGGDPVPNEIITNPVQTFTTPSDVPVAGQLGFGASNPGNLFSGCVFFLGIDKAASVQVKSRMHLECQVDTQGTAVQPFVHSSPILDNEAIDMVAKIGQVQAHGYPASFNDLSSILGSIWGAIKSVAKPFLDPVVDAAGDIPIVGGLIKGLAGKAGLGT